MTRIGLKKGATGATVLAMLVSLMTVLTTRMAYSSGELDCEPELRVKQSAFKKCNSVMALGPGNDTRVNLLLLLLDRDEPAPAFLPVRTVPAQPPAAPDDPFFDWRDLRDRFFDPTTAGKVNYAEGEGSRCRSNETGAAAFTTAINAAPDLPVDDRKALIGERTALVPTCSDSNKDAKAGQVPGETTNASVHSATGQAFATYLHGADAFYQGRFDEAVGAFSRLHGTANAWLGNSADYMVARTHVNRLQNGAFDQYGDFAGSDHVDQTAATQAIVSLQTYLHDHPDGLYVASTRGLLRRVYWLAGRTDALAAAYAAFMANPLADRDIDDRTLAEEIDSKLLPILKPAMTSDPILLAILDLRALRQTRTAAGDPAVTRIDLEAQRAAFANASPLFDYLVAAQALYGDHDPSIVIKLLPDDARRRGGDHLWFSRQLLRGLALEEKGDRNTRGFWKDLYASATRPQDRLLVELALALHEERAGTIADVFAPGSLITSSRLRIVLLEHKADAGLLRRVATNSGASRDERRNALFILLFKELTRGRYADFTADLALITDDTPADDPPVRYVEGLAHPLQSFAQPDPGELGCPLVTTTALQLARDPQAVRPRLCLTEFIRLNRMDNFVFELPPPGDDLGGTPSLFAGKPYERAAAYAAIIADREAPAADRSYALYRALTCYAPSSINECGGTAVPKEQRKAWFAILKRDYPTSRWAKALPYWW